jgi:hypothetical protein
MAQFFEILAFVYLRIAFHNHVRYVWLEVVLQEGERAEALHNALIGKLGQQIARIWCKMSVMVQC